MTNCPKGTKVFNQKEEIHLMTQLTYLKRVCEKNLFTLEGYYKSVRKTLNISYKIPVYINQELILFQTKAFKSYDNIWINHSKIKQIEFNKKEATITFLDNSTLQTNLSKYQYTNTIYKIKLITNYKLSLK